MLVPLRIPETATARGYRLARRTRPGQVPVPPHRLPPGAGAGRCGGIRRRQLGAPHLWGDNRDGGYDCSGLVQASWRVAGVGLPRPPTSRRTPAPGSPRAPGTRRPGVQKTATASSRYAGHGTGGQAPKPVPTVDTTAAPPGQLDERLRIRLKPRPGRINQRNTGQEGHHAVHLVSRR